jgi:hypothetical protein
VKERVHRLQMRIAKAIREGRHGKAKVSFRQARVTLLSKKRYHASAQY